MVKKISDRSGPGRTTPIQPTKTVGAAGVRSVGDVEAATGKSGTAPVRQKTREMTAAERERLFQLVQEEADQMFGERGLPRTRRKTIEGAVKITIDAGIILEEDEEGSDTSSSE